MKPMPILKLRTRLVAFVTMFVATAMLIIFIGGVLTFKNMGTDYVEQHIHQVNRIIDEQMTEDPKMARLGNWLPKLFRSHDVIEAYLYRGKKKLYHYQSPHIQIDPFNEQQSLERVYRLKTNSDIVIKYQILPPYTEQNYSFSAFISLSLAVLLVFFCLAKGLQWLKEQLHGSELLEERGRLILNGKLEQEAYGKAGEWPQTASLALDQLIQELLDARQERSRFDTFIRSHTFLDKLTGTANRVLFDSKLESILHEPDATGAVLVIKIFDWAHIKETIGKVESDNLILRVAEIISNLIQRYPQAVFARYYEAQFALIIPNQSISEIKRLAAISIKHLDSIQLPAFLNSNNWCHIGLTTFGAGERRGRILNEAESALKEAQIDGVNTWGQYKKESITDHYKGQVRWRNLFDINLSKQLILFNQACFQITTKKEILHYEMYVRMEDENKAIIKMSNFAGALEQLGYEEKFDRSALPFMLNFIRAQLNHLKAKQDENVQKSYALNLFTRPFNKKSYRYWFRNEILQLPHHIKSKLSFQFIESNLIQDLDTMRQVCQFIAANGCKIYVTQVGRNIVSTHYLNQVPINGIKIHRSLIKEVNLRPENQFFIRSILGACQDKHIQVFGVGIEKKKEWAMLKEMGLNGAQGRLLMTEQQIYPPLEKDANRTILNKKGKSTLVSLGKRNRWRKPPTKE